MQIEKQPQITASIKNLNVNWQAFDYQMMSKALQLAQKGQYTARPNPMVGCLIVKDKQIVGEGFHQKCGTAHAEVHALTMAKKAATGATCYVTLEPCSHQGKTGPCAQALIDSGVSRVIAAMLDPNPLVSGKGFQMLQAAGIEVEFGLMEAQAKELNRGFYQRFTQGRPWVTCKLAMSLDGRTALSSGESQWITGSAARAQVQQLRARQDAIITGIGTLKADNPSMTVREADCQPELNDWFQQAQNLGFKQPSRVVFDRQASANFQTRFFNSDTKIFWVSEKNISNVELPAHVEHIAENTQPKEVLSYLAKQGMNNVLLESGHVLAGQFLAEGLIDELIIFMAPKLMGNLAQGLFALNIEKMSQTPQLELSDVRQVGSDIRLTYRFDNKFN